MKSVRIKSSAVRRLREGGLWVYSNELADSIDGLDPGEIVLLRGADGKALGHAGIELHSLIAARLLTKLSEGADAQDKSARGEGFAAQAYLRERLGAAERARRGVVHGDCYRAAFSESDRLPGLIVDRYSNLVVIQLLTWTMERLKNEVIDAVREIFAPDAILIRNDVDVRRQSGLPAQDEQMSLGGTVDFARHQVGVLGLALNVDFTDAQKTGLFLDQMASYGFVDGLDFSGRQGADLFCYSGLFGMLALRRGARRVDFVDASERALEMVERNLAMNGFASDRWNVVRADVMEYLPTLPSRSFDFLYVDPPKFIKSKKSYYQGLQGYFTLNRAAAAALVDGAWLFTWSCSHHASEEVFRRKVTDAIEKAGRGACELARFRQNVDHPVDIAMPESFYLKGFLFRVTDRAT